VARPQIVSLIIGLGGSGKTTLIRTLTNLPDARPEVRTSRFQVHRAELWREEAGVFGPRKKDRCVIHIADYNGQRLDLFFGSIMELQAAKGSPVRYGSINALIFLCDLYPPPLVPGDPPRTDQAAVNDQLARTLGFWSTSMIDALFGLTTTSLKYLCFFVNKTDLLGAPLTSELHQEILLKYASVRSHLNKYSEGIHFRSIVGSAQANVGIPDLREDLITAAHAASQRS
jgi:hypothetical protein